MYPFQVNMAVRNVRGHLVKDCGDEDPPCPVLYLDHLTFEMDKRPPWDAPAGGRKVKFTIVFFIEFEQTFEILFSTNFMFLRQVSVSHHLDDARSPFAPHDTHPRAHRVPRPVRAVDARTPPVQVGVEYQVLKD